MLAIYSETLSSLIMKKTLVVPDQNECSDGCEPLVREVFKKLGGTGVW